MRLAPALLAIAPLAGCDGPSLLDRDGDGVALGDCDDGDPARHPGAFDMPDDGVDQDCDGADPVTDALGGVLLRAPIEDGMLGASLAAGDLNADGAADLVIGAPYFDDGGASGLVYALHGPVDAARAVDSGIRFTGLPAHQYSSVGWAVAAPGDMDGDGMGELAYSVPLAKGEDHLSGAVYVIDGPATTGNNFEEPSRVILGAERYAGLGRSLAPAGDVDGDGLADLLVGAPRTSWDVPPEDRQPGRALLFHGPVGGVTTEGDAALTLVGEEAHDGAGESVASGDFDGDGTPDVLVGGHFANPRGRAWLVHGGRTGTVSLAEADASLHGVEAGDEAGQEVASAGDLDGNGADDVLVTALNSVGDGPLEGRTYVVYGPFAGAVGLENADAVVTGAGNDDFSGAALAGFVLDDGTPAFAVGAPQHENRDSGRLARVGVYTGAVAGTLGPDDATSVWTSAEPGDRFGASVVGGMDLTGDGRPDLAVGAPDAAGRSGRVFLLTLQ